MVWVVGAGWLFEKSGLVRLDRFGQLQRGTRGKLAVAVHADLDVVTKGFTHGDQCLRAGTALERRVATRQQFLRAFDRIGVRIEADPVSYLAPQKLVDGHPERLALMSHNAMSRALITRPKLVLAVERLVLF